MKIENLDDLRAAINEMAKRNRLSIHGLEDLAKVAKGCVNRLMRVTVYSRRRDLEGQQVPVITDLQFGTVIKLVKAADYEMIIQPKQTKNRRTLILDAAREKGSRES